MPISQCIGIIGGNGWLGHAIASAAVASGCVDPARLTVSGRSVDLGSTSIPGMRRTRDNAELVDRSDVVVLSVRPDQFADVRVDLSGKLVISVMAGVPARAIADRTGAVEVVRSIPNAAAGIGRSFTPWFATPPVTAEHRHLVQTLFEACGEAAEVSLEGHIDYCVGMTGSGAAFPALLVQAMMAHAVARGLPADFALRAAKGVIVGASQLLAGPEGDPAVIVQEMIDYRGTTAAALTTMMEHGFLEAVAAGLDAAATKAAAMASA